MRKILFFIIALLCTCSCYNAIIIEDESLKWGYYTDVYIPNDSLTYYMNCAVSDVRAEFQCSERKRIETRIDTVQTSFGNYLHKQDTVTVKTMYAAFPVKEFKDMLVAIHNEGGDSPTIDIENGVFITRKLFNEIYSNYIPN